MLENISDVEWKHLKYIAQQDRPCLSLKSLRESYEKLEGEGLLIVREPDGPYILLSVTRFCKGEIAHRFGDGYSNVG